MYNVFVLTDDVSEELEVLGLPSTDSVYPIKNVNNHKIFSECYYLIIIISFLVLYNTLGFQMLLGHTFPN